MVIDFSEEFRNYCQFARQKCRHLGEKTVFYRFDAIGPEGPVVEKNSSY